MLIAMPRFAPLLCLLCFSFPIAADPIRVAAASDLTHVLPVLTERFQSRTGHTLQISYGSSGNLTRQILQGAPFEIFFSADEAYVAKLAERGLSENAGILYALGRLVFFTPEQSALIPTADLSSLAEAVRQNRLQALAIANPEHAPYGAAARQALVTAGLWEAVEKKLVLGENAAQAARFGISGNVDAALIPHAIAVAPAFSKRGRFVLLADDLYQPLRQRMALLKGAGPGARALFAFMQSDEATAVLASYGFEQPAGDN